LHGSADGHVCGKLRTALRRIQKPSTGGIKESNAGERRYRTWKDSALKPLFEGFRRKTNGTAFISIRMVL
jgi:hypothetical protein